MCTFTFFYTDGHAVKCEHVKTAEYLSSKGSITVDEQNLATHAFESDCRIHLCGDGRGYCVFGKDLRSISVEAE